MDPWARATGEVDTWGELVQELLYHAPGKSTRSASGGRATDTVTPARATRTVAANRTAVERGGKVGDGGQNLGLSSSITSPLLRTGHVYLGGGGGSIKSEDGWPLYCQGLAIV